MFRVRSVRAWGPSSGPTACALAGRRCSLWGWRRGVPGGGAFHRCEERLSSGAPLPPTARPLGGVLGSAPACCGHGRVDVGAQHCPLGLHALWGPRAAGVVGGRPWGGWPATVVRGVWCQALSLPQPPVLSGGRPGFRDPCVPGAFGAGVGTQQRPHSVRPCGPALLAVGVVEGRPREGAFHRCEGRLRSGAPTPSTARPLGGVLGSATHVLLARVCECGGPTLSLWPACPAFDKLVQMDLKVKPEFVGHKIRRRPYPAPKEQANEIERQIQECIDAGLVLGYRDGDYPQHCSPCFLVANLGLQPKGWWWTMES